MDIIKRSNEEWLKQLKLPSPECNEAMEALRRILLRGLKASFGKSRQIDSQTIEDFTQETLIRILEKLDTFNGEAAFTTWCMKIAVNFTITQLRRKRWKDISLDGLESPDALIAPGRLVRFFDGPEKRMMKRELAAMMNQMIASELTATQRKAMEIIMIHGMPLDEAAEKLNTSRNALYKAMHDARKRLKKVLEMKGMSKDEIFSMFL